VLALPPKRKFLLFRKKKFSRHESRVILRNPQNVALPQIHRMLPCHKSTECCPAANPQNVTLPQIHRMLPCHKSTECCPATNPQNVALPQIHSSPVSRNQFLYRLRKRPLLFKSHFNWHHNFLTQYFYTLATPLTKPHHFRLPSRCKMRSSLFCDVT